MIRRISKRLPALLASLSFAAAAAPTVYPTGTTIFDPERAWNGYTVLTLLYTQAVVVIDMNGNEVKRWNDYNNLAGGPARILPNGVVIAARGERPPHQEALELVQRDFDGNDIWRLDQNVQVELQDGSTVTSLRQHHDWQRADFPAGYYSPDTTPSSLGSHTLILTHRTHTNPDITDRVLEDDRIIEISSSGELLWEWTAGEHVDEFGFDAEIRTILRGAPAYSQRIGALDWLHINSATYLGPNRWYDAGDERFAPDNIMISARQASIIAIIDRSGSVVWQLGPEFGSTAELRAMRPIIGQHHAHNIPKGLPGAGNVLIFDNGGLGGYGPPTDSARSGFGVHARASSRVLEIDPMTLEVVWSYRAANFYSVNISSAQRLPNGNTLITEGAPGRVFEVNAEREIVWEYISPFFAGPRQSNSVYRAYRLPYDWIPQLDVPQERAVIPPALSEFTVP